LVALERDMAGERPVSPIRHEVRSTSPTFVPMRLKHRLLAVLSTAVVTYRFPTFTLKGGASVAVHTGKGLATTLHRYYNRTWYIWNNTGDTAYLRNAAGTLVHSCSWSSVGLGYRYC
jgi:hypothetical protein